MSEPKYAGFWVRFAANMIDTMWISLFMWGPIVVVAFGEYMDPKGPAYMFLYVFCQFLLPAILCVWFWKKWQATPGKMACRIKVVDAKTFQSASLTKYCVRYIAYFVSMIPLCLGYFWIGWDKRKRGFHDLMSKTVVVYS